MKICVPSRRFGRTELQIPLLSIGGMRFQQSWKDLEFSEVSSQSQDNLEATLNHAASFGLNHIETARHYGSSEIQLGHALSKTISPEIFLQTKVPPNEDPKVFEAELELSFEKLNVEKVDLLSIHGLNLVEHLDQTLRPGGCLEVVRRWQRIGKIDHIGFSTHAPTELIVEAIRSNEFDYVNLHWYFIRQDNEPALYAASMLDMGVFIISPTDKGGHLHTPSSKLLELCSPIHPIIFNDLFCLRDSRVHTISVGLTCPGDLDLHLQAIDLIDRANDIVPEIAHRFQQAAFISLGEIWIRNWKVGLPAWHETPGNINIPILLWLHNLVEAWGMEGYAKARYNLLGQASHWFPGRNADCLDTEVSEESLRKVLVNSPWVDEIPDILRGLRNRFGGNSQERLSIS